MRIRHALAAATAGLVLTTTTAAHAAVPRYGVEVNGASTAGFHSATGTSVGAVQFRAKNNAETVVHFGCTSLNLFNYFLSGSNVNPVAVVGSTTWTGCGIPGMPMTITQSGTWVLAGTGYATAADLDHVDGYVGNVNAHVQTTANPLVCSFNLVGQMNATLDEASDELDISELGYTGNLTLSNVKGCLGQLQNGNPAEFEATLKLDQDVNLF